MRRFSGKISKGQTSSSGSPSRGGLCPVGPAVFVAATVSAKVQSTAGKTAAQKSPAPKPTPAGADSLDTSAAGEPAQTLAKARLQRIHPHPLARRLRPMLLFLARASGGLSHLLPMGGLISSADKTACFHKRFQQLQTPAVLRAPVRGHPSRQAPQQMTG